MELPLVGEWNDGATESDRDDPDRRRAMSHASRDGTALPPIRIRWKVRSATSRRITTCLLKPLLSTRPPGRSSWAAIGSVSLERVSRRISGARLHPGMRWSRGSCRSTSARIDGVLHVAPRHAVSGPRVDAATPALALAGSLLQRSAMTSSRRDFLRVSGGCIAHLALASACAPLMTRRRWTAPAHPTAATAPFARLDLIGRDTWALVSTPLGGDRTTFANGGIIAGRTGVIAVEGFYRPAGAEWLAQRARELTGRWPTHVVLTHYHTDHAGGLAGYANAGALPKVRATAKTRELALSGGPVAPARDDALMRAFADVVIVPANNPGTIDLGNRRVRLDALSGHTASDVAIIDEDAGITWAGDLMWNGMFPNFVDAMPDTLATSVRHLERTPARTFVPGHGAVADRAALTRYLALLDEIEMTARRGFKDGTTATQLAATYTIPATLGDWMASKPALERAMTAWYRQLAAR